MEQIKLFAGADTDGTVKIFIMRSDGSMHALNLNNQTDTDTWVDAVRKADGEIGQMMRVTIWSDEPDWRRGQRV